MKLKEAAVPMFFLTQRWLPLLRIKKVKEILLSSRTSMEKNDKRQGPFPSNFKRPPLSRAWCYQGLPPNPHLCLEGKKKCLDRIHL